MPSSAAHDLQRVLARHATAPDVQAGEVGGAAEAELQELEVVVDAGLVVVQVLVVDHRSFDRLVVGGEAVRLRDQRVRQAVPRQVVAEEESGHADPLQLLVGGIGVVNQMLRLDAVHADQVATRAARAGRRTLRASAG